MRRVSDDVQYIELWAPLETRNLELGTRNSKFEIHDVYAAGLNSQTGLADWVAYRMTKEAVGVASLLSRSWQPDRVVKIPDELEIMESAAAQVSLARISQSDNPYGGGTLPP